MNRRLMNHHAIRYPRLCAAIAISIAAHLSAATVQVGNIALGGFEAGDTLQIPVTVTGITPSAFTAFTLSLNYDTNGVRLDSIERGGLIDATGNAAVGTYAPHLWALESVHDTDAGRVDVAGMILQDLADDNTLPGMADAFPGTDTGTLLLLNVTLRDTQASAIALVGGGTDGRCALLHETSSLVATLESTSDQLLSGGINQSVISAAWVEEWFASGVCDEHGDDDGDWRTNLVEFQEETDPTTPDQRVPVKEGWNLVGFSAVPVEKNADWRSAINASFADSGGTGTLVTDQIFHFESDASSYRATVDFEPTRGYWIRAEQDGDIDCTGVPVAADWTFGTGNGWHLVSTPETLSVSQLPADVVSCFGWDPAIEQYTDDVQELLPGHAYWLFRYSVR